MVHQNKKTNFGSSFYLSKPEGIGMASIRVANCMELRLVRVWHQPIGCISSTSVSIPYRNSLRIPCAHCVSNSIHGFAVIRSTLVVLFLFLGRMKGLEVGAGLANSSKRRVRPANDRARSSRETRAPAKNVAKQQKRQRRKKSKISKAT